jgi:hypothetical protein
MFRYWVQQLNGSCPSIYMVHETSVQQFGAPIFHHQQTKTNSLSFSLQANYTSWATTTCQRNLVPTFVDRGVSRGQHDRSPTVVNLSFLDQSRYFSFKQLLIYPHQGWVDPIPDPLLLRKCDTGNRTRDLLVSNQELWPLDHRDGHIQTTWYQDIPVVMDVMKSVYSNFSQPSGQV